MSIALTGIRPTGELTVANLAGAMQPMVDLQGEFDTVNIFAADLHGLTDQEPDLVNQTRINTVRSLLAAGINPDQTTVYLQSQIESPTVMLASTLDRHVSLNELMRVPTLKEKLRSDQTEGQATVALARYPILMAADICIQDATHVPVGKDQLPHIEFTRDAVDRFNRQYGNGDEVLVKPDLFTVDSIRIASLDGQGKMSKSRPNGAILLKDGPDEVTRKIRRAQTAMPGEMTEVLDSHFTLSEALARGDEETIRALDDLRRRHMEGGKVMGEFKPLMAEVINRSLAAFQERYDSLSDDEVHQVIAEGGEKALAKADEVLTRVRSAMGFVPFR